MINGDGESEVFYINCNNGSFLIKIIKKDDAFWQAKAFVESDWFQCEVNFECSIERAIEFSDFLKTLLQNGGGEVHFINEDGNVDLNINLNSKGQVRVVGCVCKNMIDKSLVNFDLDSGRNELEKFCEDFERYF